MAPLEQSRPIRRGGLVGFETIPCRCAGCTSDGAIVLSGVFAFLLRSCHPVAYASQQSIGRTYLPDDGAMGDLASVRTEDAMGENRSRAEAKRGDQ
jgi:hypothetical protein